MPIYEYKCEDGHIGTRLRSISHREVPTTCKKCEKDAFYIISTPTVTLDGTDEGFPDAYSKFSKVHESYGS